jgi:hypothetical protein
MSAFALERPKTRNIWITRVLPVVVLLALAVGLGYLHIKGTYKPYMNCRYVVSTGLHLPDMLWVCNGINTAEYMPRAVTDIVNLGLKACFWDGCPKQVTWPFISGLEGLITPTLEFFRKVAVWAILIFFVFVSMFLTIMINNITTIIRILTFNSEEWKRLLGTLRTFGLILGVFLLLFLFSVYRTGGLKLNILPAFLRTLLGIPG